MLLLNLFIAPITGKLIAPTTSFTNEGTSETHTIITIANQAIIKIAMMKYCNFRIII